MTTFYAQPSFHYWHEFYINQEQPVVVVPQYHHQIPQYEEAHQQMPHLEQVVTHQQMPHLEQVVAHQQMPHLEQVVVHQQMPHLEQVVVQQQMPHLEQVVAHQQIPHLDQVVVHQQITTQHQPAFAITPPNAINVQDLENEMYMEANKVLLFKIKELQKENITLHNDKLVNQQIVTDKDMQIQNLRKTVLEQQDRIERLQNQNKKIKSSNTNLKSNVSLKISQIKNLEVIGINANKAQRKIESKLQEASKKNESLQKDVKYLVVDRTNLREKLQFLKNSIKNVATTTKSKVKPSSPVSIHPQPSTANHPQPTTANQSTANHPQPLARAVIPPLARAVIPPLTSGVHILSELKDEVKAAGQTKIFRRQKWKPFLRLKM